MGGGPGGAARPAGVSRGAKQTIVGMGGFVVVLLVIVVLSSNANRTQGLRADVLSARRGEPNQNVDVTVSVRDTKGRVTNVEVDFGDGRVETVELADERCGEPLNRSFDLTHQFDFTGYTTIVAKVSTGGCGASPEQVEAIRTIQIKTVRRSG